MKHPSERSTLIFKPRADVTRSPRTAYRWSYKKDWGHLKKIPIERVCFCFSSLCQSGQPYLLLVQAYVLHIPWDWPLVQHLLNLLAASMVVSQGSKHSRFNQETWTFLLKHDLISCSGCCLCSVSLSLTDEKMLYIQVTISTSRIDLGWK